MLLSMRMLLPVLLPMLRNHNLLPGFFTASASPCTSPLPSPISVLGRGGGHDFARAHVFVLPTGLVCDGVLLVSVTPCPLIYSVYTLLCTVTGGRADRRCAPGAAPRRPRPRAARALLSHESCSLSVSMSQRDPHPETVLLHALASSHTTKTHSHLLLHVEVCPQPACTPKG